MFTAFEKELVRILDKISLLDKQEVIDAIHDTSKAFIHELYKINTDQNNNTNHEKLNHDLQKLMKISMDNILLITEFDMKSMDSILLGKNDFNERKKILIENIVANYQKMYE